MPLSPATSTARRFRLLVVLLLSPLFLLQSACDGGDELPADPEAEGLDTPLTDAQILILEEAAVATVDLGEVVLPNGRTVESFLDEYGLLDPDGLQAGSGSRSVLPPDVGPQAQRNLVIALMTQLAYKLTNRSQFVYPEEPAQGGIARPAQRGLAYSYGSKGYAMRERPTEGECRQAAVYGLDCSGLVYLMARAANLTIPVGTANTQRDPAIWNTAFERAGLDKLVAEDLGQIDRSDFETGDIVYWMSGNVASHIGIVLKDASGQLAVYQSNGTPRRSQNCEKNYGPTRGPQPIYLDNSAFFSGEMGRWGVTRFTVDLSGTWTLRGRCEGRDTDAFELTVEITNEADQSVTASGTGTDYDGSRLEVAMDGTYSTVTNLLASDINFTFPESGGRRTDRFSIRLDDDDTGYFITELIFHSGSGCPLEVRLANQETAPPPTARAGRAGTGTGQLLD